ncbi:MAG: hypothetical protein LBF12_05250 [Christensenellaceae bacterium]|nr:hypothetical protein [Christensenellaceae bacterium]
MINYQFAETLKNGDLLVTCSKCTHMQIVPSEEAETATCENCGCDNLQEVLIISDEELKENPIAL